MIEGGLRAALGHSSTECAGACASAYRVDGQAGPTDLRTIQNQLAYYPATGTPGQTWGGR